MSVATDTWCLMFAGPEIAVYPVQRTGFVCFGLFNWYGVVIDERG